MERPSKRQPDELRKVVIEPNVNKHAEGSCLIKCGDTHVICTATVEDKVPMWMRNSGRGWVTAEYGMIPLSGEETVRCVGRVIGRLKEEQIPNREQLRMIEEAVKAGERRN